MNNTYAHIPNVNFSRNSNKAHLFTRKHIQPLLLMKGKNQKIILKKQFAKSDSKKGLPSNTGLIVS